MQAAQQLQSWNSAEPEIVAIPNRLDSGTASTVEDALRARIQNGTRELVLDCAELHSLTSIGMHSLLKLAKDMRAAGGKLAVCNLSGQAKAMFDACGYQAIIAVYSDKDSAVTAIAA